MDCDRKSPEIVICLGSSCFARGNCDHLSTIKNFLAQRGLEAKIEFRGLLCQDQCKLGPNVKIGDEQYHDVTPERLAELLSQLGALQERNDG